MKIIVLVLLLAFMNIGGCGGGSSSDDGCDFNFNGFLNGSNAQSQTSEWACLASDGNISTFAAFEDGTGVSTEYGIFTYNRSGCRSATYQGLLDSGELVNLEGSIALGILSFVQLSDNFGQFDVGCLLVIL